MVKKKQHNKINLVTIVIIIFLILTNIILLSACLTLKDKDIDTQEILYTVTKEEFNPDKKYYATILFQSGLTVLATNIPITQEAPLAKILLAV